MHSAINEFFASKNGAGGDASLAKAPMGAVEMPLLAARGPSSPPYFSRKRVILTALAFVLLTTVFAVIFVVYWRVTVCTTPECVLTAARMLSRMDQSVDPCDDFYEFACGTWVKHSVNLNYPSWNSLYETTMRAHDTIVQTILKVVDGDFSLPLNRGERAAVELFRQCTDMDTLQRIGLNTWLQFVDEMGGWIRELESEISEPPLELALLQAFNYSVFPLFWAGVEVNYFDSKHHLITIYEQLPLLLNPSVYQFDIPVTAEMILNRDGPQATSLLQEAGEELAVLLGLDRHSRRVREMIAQMIELEWRITVSGSRFYKNKKELYEVISLGELQAIAPGINWLFFLTTLVGEKLNEREEIALKTGREWVVKLSQIIVEYSETDKQREVLRNYIKWKIIFFHLAYVKPKCKEGYLWSVVDIYSGPPHLRKEFCIMRASGIFPLSLPSLLRKIDGDKRSRKNKKLVESIARNIIDEYHKVLKQSLILDNTTESMALNKLSNMSMLISYPDQMNNERVVENEANRISQELFWSMVYGARAVYLEKISRLRKPVNPRDWVDSKPALSSTPIHNYERNLVQVPFDAVRAPIADTDQTDLASYASVGSIIGHEITHAFDEQVVNLA